MIIFRRAKVLALVIALLFTRIAAWAGGDEVLVVFNSNQPKSRDVAEYYAAKRGVPPSQVVGLKIGPETEMTREEFRSQLQLPLARLFEERKLWEMVPDQIPNSNGAPPTVFLRTKSSKIRYLLLCYGVPFRISEDSTLQESGAASLRPELRRNGAAVDSELAWLPILSQKPILAGWLGNPGYAATNRESIGPTHGMLMVARLDGPSPEISKGLVDKALEAERNGFWGRAYFDLRSTTEPGLKLGDEWLGEAATTCRNLGYETVVDKEPPTFPSSFPLPQIAIYAGWYEENVCGPFNQDPVEFMPGAFAYHLHSFNGSRLRQSDKNWVGPLLAKGATITMGSVAEPFLTGTPNISVFCHRLLHSGFSFGEAAYASIGMLSWQTTVVGDPLYRPAAKSPEMIHAELLKNDSPFLEWSYLRLVNINLEAHRSAEELAFLLESLEQRKTSAILNEKLGDLYSAQGKPSSAVRMWEQALQLRPSVQQRLALRLKLADKLQSLNRQSEAVAQLEQLIQERPQYPGRPQIQQRINNLSSPLEKTLEPDQNQKSLSSQTNAAPS